jgi:hypothetical protein
MLKQIENQKEVCEMIEKAFLTGHLVATEAEMTAVWKMKRVDKPLRPWHLSVLRKLVERIG